MPVSSPLLTYFDANSYLEFWQNARKVVTSDYFYFCIEMLL